MDYQTLNLLFRYNKEFSHKKIRMQELSDTECMLCSYIYSHENCSQDDAAETLKIDKTTVGKALVSLERKSCVKRSLDPEDKRIKRLSLTELGQKKMAELIDLHDHWLREIMTCLSREEQENFENYCRRLLEAAKKLEED